MSAGSGLLREFEFVPVLDTAIYAAGDVLFVPVEIKDVFSRPVSDLGTDLGNIALNSITLLDEDQDTFAFDLVIANASFSLGTLNGAFALSVADERKIQAIHQIDSADAAPIKIALTTSNFYQYEGLAIQIQQAAASRSIWVGGILRTGTPTFGAATDFRIRLGVTQD